MPAKILFVDDDANIPAGFKRHLRKIFDLETALGAKDGLHVINEKGPFSVIEYLPAYRPSRIDQINSHILLSTSLRIFRRNVSILLGSLCSIEGVTSAFRRHWHGEL